MCNFLNSKIDCPEMCTIALIPLNVPNFMLHQVSTGPTYKREPNEMSMSDNEQF